MLTRDALHAYAATHFEEALALLKELAAIPAPSGQEGRRAERVLAWLHQKGGTDAYIDEALNVVLPFTSPDTRDTAILMAHTDIVFPDEGPIAVTEENGRLLAPGVGDDTANLVCLLMAAAYVLEQGLKPRLNVVVAANAGEEGLGNLKGCRQIMQQYGDRTVEFISFDGTLRKCTATAVGSQRYRVQVQAEGGHSYGAFGNESAIHRLAEMIVSLHQQQVPTKAKTTYNVGVIEGGTTVNTIAESAQMLYEFRSEDRDCLRAMETSFRSIVDSFRSKGIRVNVEVLGIRPCNGDIDPQKHQRLIDRSLSDMRALYPGEVKMEASSTDANIPLSMGIPAVTFGLIEGGRAHTYEEWISIDSLHTGLALALRTLLYSFG
jgi:acetylornithine deacetylase/succinyl-diaminopimelate desuccinylase-like protein